MPSENQQVLLLRLHYLMGLDRDFWDFIIKWNIGLVIVYIFFGAIGEGWSDGDAAIYFFALNAPLWTVLLFVWWEKLTK